MGAPFVQQKQGRIEALLQAKGQGYPARTAEQTAGRVYVGRTGLKALLSWPEEL
jgi:hypothetical protein